MAIIDYKFIKEEETTMDVFQGNAFYFDWEVAAQAWLNNSIADNKILTEIVSFFTMFGEELVLIAVLGFLYWCYDKKFGKFVGTNILVGLVLLPMLKNIFFRRRPYFDHESIKILKPVDSSADIYDISAQGYSFPSGHTTTATPIYGGLAVSTWKKLRWISVLCIICIAITGFSRNYLGVHTPQDVLVGLTEGALALWGMAVLFKYLEKHPEKENIFLAAGIVFCIGALIYITLKSYPMDYDADGALLVDPQKMMRDGYSDIGKFMAFCAARFIEKTWVKYSPALTQKTLAAGLVGAVLTFFIIDTVKSPLRSVLGQNWGAFAASAVIVSFIVVIWPAIMKAVAGKDKN